MGERGVEVDHSTLNRWIVRYSAAAGKVFVSRKRPVAAAGGWTRPMCGSRVSGSISTELSKAGATVDFLLTGKRDRKAALRFMRKAVRHHSVPEKITIDKSGANMAPIELQCRA
jgi:transposase-like protein